MSIKAGLVGLPNVGKSTLFNALTGAGVPAENFPFCTIDPHVAIAAVPDKRLDRLAEIFQSSKKIPSTVQFVDIAGLVSGASKGEGLGNKFLSHIMEVDLIIHVLRCFDDGDVTHVSDAPDPIDDFNVIVTELMLKDMESLSKRAEKIKNLYKKAKSSGDNRQVKSLEEEEAFVKKLQSFIDIGDHQGVIKVANEAQEKKVELIPLLSGKKFIVAANFSEDDFSSGSYASSEYYKKLVEKFGKDYVIPVSAKIESELALLAEGDREDFMASLGIKESGLDRLIVETYHCLDLISFFTCGPKEAHSWPIPRETVVSKAAGTIHSDLERGFICSEVYNCSDIFESGSEAELKKSGRIRTEGKDYILQDGDVIHVRFNV